MAILREGVRWAKSLYERADQVFDDVSRTTSSYTGVTGPSSVVKGAASTVGATGKFMGRGAYEYGRDLGKDVVDGAKWFHKNRNSAGVTAAAGVGALALMPSAYESGQLEAKHERKMAQVASNMSVSNDGGGTFLRQNQSPQVQDMGATGDLVFALHSLRNGGQ